MVEIKQEERVGSPFIRSKIIFYIYVRIVEMKFIKFVSQIHSALQEQERGSKFGCISRVSHLTNRPYSESVVLGDHFFNLILTLPSLQTLSHVSFHFRWNAYCPILQVMISKFFLLSWITNNLTLCSYLALYFTKEIQAIRKQLPASHTLPISTSPFLPTFHRVEPSLILSKPLLL